MRYRALQALADLRAVARAASPKVAAGISDGQNEAFTKLVGTEGCRFSPGTARALYDRVRDLAYGFNENSDLALIAAVILVAHALQDEAGDPAALWHVWKDRLDAGNPTHAALYHGFAGALSARPGVGPPPELAHPFFSKGRDAVLVSLISLARTMTRDEIDTISRYDHGHDADEQRHALEAVLARDDCLMTEDEYWLPAEVVQLAAHVPDGAGFIPCTALMLIEAIHTGDYSCYIVPRWEALHGHFRGLPARTGEPILAGFRYGYEANIFDPWGRDERGVKAAEKIVIPWPASVPVE